MDAGSQRNGVSSLTQAKVDCIPVLCRFPPTDSDVVGYDHLRYSPRPPTTCGDIPQTFPRPKANIVPPPALVVPIMIAGHTSATTVSEICKGKVYYSQVLEDS